VSLADQHKYTAGTRSIAHTDHRAEKNMAKGGGKAAPERDPSDSDTVSRKEFMHLAGQFGMVLEELRAIRRQQATAGDNSGHSSSDALKQFRSDVYRKHAIMRNMAVPR
jgi:hypothetical protein